MRRWESFNWRLQLQRPDYLSGEWYTYRHPKLKGGGFDYKKLAKVPLDTFLKVKDQWEL